MPSPFLILGAAAAGLWYLNRRKQQKAREAAAAGAGTQQPIPGNGALPPSGPGFAIGPGCSTFVVTDPPALEAAMGDFYRARKLAGGVIGNDGVLVEGGLSPDGLARSFLRDLGGVNAVTCVPPGHNATETGSSSYVITQVPGGWPGNAPLAQQIIYWPTMLSFLAQLNADGQVSDAVTEEMVTQINQAMLDRGVTKADWIAVFQGTLPVPEILKTQIQGGQVGGG